jgi:hypothetical protein
MVKIAAGVLALLALVVATPTEALADGQRDSFRIPGFGWLVGDGAGASVVTGLVGALWVVREFHWSSPAEIRAQVKQQESIPAPLRPFRDQGDPGAIASIKANVINDLTRDLSVQQVGTSYGVIKQSLDLAYAPAAAPQEIRDTARALAEQQAGTLNAANFSNSDIAVDRWLGVKATGDSAVVLLDGQERLFLLPQRQWVNRPFRWQLYLSRQGDRWKITRNMGTDKQLQDG